MCQNGDITAKRGTTKEDTKNCAGCAEPLPQLPGHQSALYGQRHQPSYADGGRDRAYRNGRRELLLRPGAYSAKLQKSP